MAEQAPPRQKSFTNLMADFDTLANLPGKPSEEVQQGYLSFKVLPSHKVPMTKQTSNPIKRN